MLHLWSHNDGWLKTWVCHWDELPLSSPFFVRVTNFSNFCQLAHCAASLTSPSPFLPLSPQGQKVIDDHSQPCSGSTGSSQILQKPSSHHKELQLAPQFDQNPHLPPPSLPRPVQAPLPSCMPIKELIHTLQHSPSLREQHGDLLHLSATLRLHSIRFSSKKNAWFFTFPQTTAQSSATRPGPLSCVLKTTLRPPHSTSTCSSVPNMSCLNDQPT